jgi:hypothetical protein
MVDSEVGESQYPLNADTADGAGRGNDAFPEVLKAVDSPAYRLLADYVSRRLPDEELFDLDQDPEGMNNLAGDSALAEKLAELRQAADAWAERTDDRKTRGGLAQKFPPSRGVVP